MKKKIVNNDAYFAIGWSKTYKYDRIMAARILPELPGILYFYENRSGRLADYLCYACWRDGLRMGIKLLLDPVFSKNPHLMKKLENRDLYYRYCIIDSNPSDMQDIMYWIIRSYRPSLNNIKDFSDSKRYSEICVREVQLTDSQVELKIPGM